MKISFIIPFHNEEKNCLPMLDRVVKFAEKNKITYEIIPVDDRSTDDTRQVLIKTAQKNPHIRPIYRPDNGEEKGNTMGKALIEGTRSSTGNIIIWTMGDLADDTQTYLQIIHKISTGFDMVFGSRYMPGGSRGNLDILKAFLSSWGTRLAQLLFKVQAHDITNAFRGFRREVFDNIRLESAGFSISPEFAIKAHLAGFKLGEVPTVYTNRIEGVSSFKLFKMTKSYLNLYFNLYWRYKVNKQSAKYSHS